MSKLFTLNRADLIKGAITAVFTAILMGLATTVNQPGFNLFTADWGGISQVMLSTALATFIGYLTKNFLSDSNGAVLGKVGGEDKKK